MSLGAKRRAERNREMASNHKSGRSRGEGAQIQRTSPFAALAARGSRIGPGVAFVILLAAALLAYADSFRTPFLFDGEDFILHNEQLRQLWPPKVLLAVNNRPIGFLTFAVDHALSGENVVGYHATNLAIHVVAAWLLFAILRRAFGSPKLPPRYHQAAVPLALVIALLWLVHPLQTQSVTYIYQRLESLMGLFYLATLYGFLRAQEGRRPLLWYAFSVICLALGLGTKEVAATAPLLVLWYDRVLVAESWRELARRRWAYYAVIFGMLAAPAAFILTHRAFYAAGGALIADPTWYAYARTQPEVILHYLRLAVWPAGQCLDYGWPVATRPLAMVAAAAVVGALLIAVAWAVVRRPALGLAGGAFFLILAPTSSFVPIRDIAFEHRMYLSLAAVIVLAVVAVFEAMRAARWEEQRALGTLVAAAVPLAIVLLALTAARNRVYASSVALWENVVAIAPANARGWYNLGQSYEDEGRSAEAIRAYAQAMELDPSNNLARLNHANLMSGADPARAVDEYLEVLRRVGSKDRFQVDAVSVHINLARAYAMLGRGEESLAHARQAVTLDPRSAGARINLANVLAERDPAAAERELQAALQLDPRSAEAHNNLGGLLAERRPQEALAHLQRAVEIDPSYAEAHFNLGNLLAHQGQLPAAIAHLQRAVAARPQWQPPRQLLQALLGSGETRPRETRP